MTPSVKQPLHDGDGPGFAECFGYIFCKAQPIEIRWSTELTESLDFWPLGFGEKWLGGAVSRYKPDPNAMTPDPTTLLPTITLLQNAMTPAILLIGLMFGYLAFTRYQRDSFKRWEVEREWDAVGRSSTVVTVNQAEAALEKQLGGFAFIEVADEYKTLFADAMNGFADFARLKGYNVELSFDTSLPGKVGIRFMILDSGVTVSTATVRRDVDEYIERLHSADDLSDMPMAANSVEHGRLLSALQARFSYLRMQAEMLTVQADFYKRIINEWDASTSRAISYASPVQVHLTNEGWRNMRDSYNAENSQNVAQGKGAKALTKGSTVRIGSTLNEKTKQVNSLKELETAIHEAQLPDEPKQVAIRHVLNACEEMEDSANPNPDDIGKWLGRADTALKTAGAAAGLLEKVHEVLGMFGLIGT